MPLLVCLKIWFLVILIAANNIKFLASSLESLSISSDCSTNLIRSIMKSKFISKNLRGKEN